MEPSRSSLDQPSLETSSLLASSSGATRLNSGRLGTALFWGFIALVSLGLLIYSQTFGFVWDEGFHLLTAQLIGRGKTPYLDFCFPQPPLNAYWNAAWMHLAGETWRVTHVLAALEAAGAVAMMGQYVLRRFPDARWRLPAALTVSSFIGLSAVVFQFAPIAQAYGLCLFLLVASFRITVRAADRPGSLAAFFAGILAGAAAGSSLLSATFVPVAVLWIFFCNRAGSRVRKLIASAAGALIPFAPVFWLFSKSPRQIFFNIVQYQALFRRVKWNGATPHDVDVLSSWLADAQSLFLGLLAIAGVWFVIRQKACDRAVRAEFYLCAWSTAAATLYISTAHPTFSRYFIVAIPFASVLAVTGMYWAGSRLAGPNRPLWPSAFLCGILALALGRDLFDTRDFTTWHDYEEIARKVDRHAPRSSEVYVDELVYFLTRRTPPSGMEFSYSHKLDLPPAEEKLFHVVSEKELNQQVKEGRFAVVESCNDDRIDEMKLADLYSKKEDVKDCSIFWDKIKPPPADDETRNK